MTLEPLMDDAEHQKLWDALSELKTEVSMNGYGDILRGIARRAMWRAGLWKALTRPRAWLARFIWIVIGALAFVEIENLAGHPVPHP